VSFDKADLMNLVTNSQLITNADTAVVIIYRKWNWLLCFQICTSLHWKSHVDLILL